MRAASPARIAAFLFAGLVLLWLILPVLIVIPMSFSDSRFLTFPPKALSLRWYHAYLGSSLWLRATRVSLGVAAASAVLATAIGTAAAYALNLSNGRAMKLVKLVLLLPLMVPIVITGVGIFLVYARVGLLATLTGLVLANTMLGVPYALTSVLGALAQFDPAQEMVARSLGMNRPRAFFAVTLPQIAPGVLSGALFAFVAGLDETVVALFISGGRYQPLTKRMFTALRDEIDPTIAAISTMLTLVSCLVAAAVMLNARWSERRRGVRA
ncbi:ABC transporter permease [Gluconacetobacter azotocaptans]|uniref:ABC transporter permease n=1 Tax=Gluconacetobacter azotocaptans TaxID=142834 RepID=A0A7W4JVX6_9PROT|nr:ABC transporter permease [Gluconacetobacter azotocaptans]MBB2191898.1 ABC transporter permease [Gluconacetobacter azotocaptans]GBQ33382.1 spermidine/putrescine ABC transporter permease [Gluconacetobacter azotocaptans DSM 13594]